MVNDIRIYNYYDDGPMVNRTTQIKEYLEKQLSNVEAKVDFTEVEKKIADVKETVTTSTTDIKEAITDSTIDIKEAIEDAKPCLCHLATKDDVTKAKTEIIDKIDEKFVDLNELIKQ